MSLLLKGTAATGFAVLALFGMTATAYGPGYGSTEALEPPHTVARLTRSGENVVLTGSVDNVFQNAAFVGPNRTEKQDRARPAPDVMAVARSLQEIRTRLAALRATPSDPTNPQQSTLAVAAIDMGPSKRPTLGSAHSDDEVDEPRISVASVDSNLASAALDAIDEAAGTDSSTPMPISVPESLAYARANTPATTFDTPVKMDKVSDKQLECLATAIYFEARGENYRGQVAVAQVVLNRVKHKLYPNTICGVVFQNQHRRNACQFSFACDGIPERVTEKKAWAQAEEIARKVTSGSIYLSEIGKATHYHATYVYPHWAPRMTKLSKIGLHVFYQFRKGWVGT